MISNLESARALIQVDLDHARSLVALWTDQVTELEKALEQINLVDNSRTALRGVYQGQKGSAPALTTDNGKGGKAPRERKLKQAAAGQLDHKPRKQRAAKSVAQSAKPRAAEGKSRAASRSPRGITAQMGKKRAVSGVAKYRDPNSNKTWTGHGRRPGWMVGAPEQYAIDHQAGSQSAPIGSKNGGVDTAGMTDGSA